MTIRQMPGATLTARPGLRTVPGVTALERWHPAVRAAKDEPDNTISVLDVIGEDFWSGEGVTAKRISAALRTIGKREVVVNVNSPGGDFFEGLAIYNMLREHPAKVTVRILGIAASAASVIAMAGDEIRIARAGFLMIHNTWVVAMGDKNALRGVADWLEPFDETAADIYAARSGLEAKAIGKMLDRETWIGGKEAVEQGFADSLLASDEVTEDAKARAEAGSTVAMHKLDTLLAKAGVPRSERRRLFGDIKSGTPSAADDGMPGAAVITKEVEGLLATLKTM